jgi:hypothetical protein
MENDLRRACGKMTEADFNRASERLCRMDAKNVDIARAFFLHPGELQTDIARKQNVSRQLVHKYCKKIYDSHRLIIRGSTKKDG